VEGSGITVMGELPSESTVKGTPKASLNCALVTSIWPDPGATAVKKGIGILTGLFSSVDK
jgi:hypothetical protein